MTDHVRKVVLEEHFLTPALAPYAAEIERIIDPEHFKFYKARLFDFDNLRLEEMDKFGIDMSVLSVTTPGVQREPDAQIAVKRAREANDFLAEVISRHPTRFSGFAHLAMQDPKWAADELERGVRDLGLKGALINGHTNGEYLDDPKFSPVWERAESLDVPIYLHPANAMIEPACVEGYPELMGPAWAWGAETASHVLRLVYGGVFDRFPKTNVIIGHMGETLPFVLWRLDSRYRMMRHGKPIKKMPSQYMRENVVITTSGACDFAPLLCSMMSIGSDRIMFSVDYPYESTEDSVRFIENAAISQLDMERICHLNAERILHL